MAKLYFRFGSMGSSKTANALMVKYNYEERGGRVRFLKPVIDNRDHGNKIRSRIGLETEVICLLEDADILSLILSDDNPSPISCIIVDEAQFLTKNQVLALCTLVDTHQIPVVCYGLRSDFQGNLFEGSHWLLAYADSIEEVKTICFCGKKATMNLRLQDGIPIKEGEQIFIGGNESYISVCRKHFFLEQFKPTST